MYYYNVAPKKVFRKDSDFFTYCSDVFYEIGSIVKIPVGKQEVIGLVISSTTKPDYETKKIISKVVDNPLPIGLVKTIVWISQYYASPLATVLTGSFTK